MNEKAILLAVDSLQRIFAIVLALSLGEALQQFVADKSSGSERAVHIQWNRLMGLLAFLLLLIPFYQGMAQYLYQAYETAQRPKPYAAFLLVDCGVFTFEASLFFVMSRALPIIQWRRFYEAVLILLVADTVWGAFLWLTHHQAVLSWLVLNLVSIPVFTAILLAFRSHQSRWGPSLAFAAMTIRTVADYWTSWQFYFPP